MFGKSGKINQNKMKVKTINVPIYDCYLTIIFTKDLNEVVKKYKLEGNWGEKFPNPIIVEVTLVAVPIPRTVEVS